MHSYKVTMKDHNTKELFFLEIQSHSMEDATNLAKAAWEGDSVEDVLYITEVEGGL